MNIDIHGKWYVILSIYRDWPIKVSGRRLQYLSLWICELMLGIQLRLQWIFERRAERRDFNCESWWKVGSSSSIVRLSYTNASGSLLHTSFSNIEDLMYFCTIRSSSCYSWKLIKIEKTFRRAQRETKFTELELRYIISKWWGGHWSHVFRFWSASQRRRLR